MLPEIKRYIFSAALLAVVALGAIGLDAARSVHEAQVAAVAAAPAPSPNAELGKLTGSLYQNATAPQSARAPEAAQASTASQRATLMLGLAETNPTAFLGYALPKEVRAKLSKSVQAQIEEYKTLTGEIEVLHIDDFENHENSKFKYFLRVGGKRLALYAAQDLPALLSGSQLTIKGYQLSDIIVTTGGSTEVTVRKAAKPESVGNQRVLFLLVKENGVNAPLSKKEMQEYILSGPFQQFYKEQSYDRVRFSGTVTDWISLAQYPDSACLSTTILGLDQPAEVKNYIISNGINLSNYDRVAYIIHGRSGGCAVIGKGLYDFNGSTYRLSLSWNGALLTPSKYDSYVDEKLSESRDVPNEYATYLCRKTISSNPGRHVKCVVAGWVVIYDSSTGVSRLEEELLGGFGVLEHEMGHNLGVAHANAWYCHGPSLNENCDHEEYGNNFDEMGTGSLGTHFNAYYKDILGWLKPADKKVISKTGTYSLAPFESMSGIRALILKNPRFDSGMAPGIAYLEYRQSVGFDRKIPPLSSGIHINYLTDKSGLPLSTHLINPHYMSDFSPPWQPWRALTSGESFSDNRYGITLDSVAIASTSATLAISIVEPVCETKGIRVTEDHYDPQIMAGERNYFSITVANEDFPACEKSEIVPTASITQSEGWSKSAGYPDSFTSVPGAKPSNIYITYFVPNTAPSGDHTLTFTVRDSTHNRTYTIEKTITVTRPPETVALTSLDPSTGAEGTEVVVNGSGFMTSNTVHVGTQSVTATSSSVNSLTFNIPAALSPGSYDVSVENGNGTSNALLFTVEGGGEGFVIGDRVQTTQRLVVRDAAGGAKVGVVGANWKGSIIGGPTVKGKNTWWQINWSIGETNTLGGWSAEAYLEKAPPKFDKGDTITTTNRLVVRDRPAGARVGVQKVGALGTVVGGPIDIKQNTWWQMDWDTGVDGWSVEQYLQ